MGQHEQSLQRTFHRYFLLCFGSFGQMVSEKIFRNRPIRNKNCLWRHVLLMDLDSILNLKPETRITYGGHICQWIETKCLLMDQNEMSNLYREPFIDASYKVSYRIFIVLHIVVDGRISTIDHLICIGNSERKLILVTTNFFITFLQEVFKCCLGIYVN